MINRKIGNQTWNVISPSEYTVQGYEAIRAKFDGKKWYLMGAWQGPNSFDTMSLLVKDFDCFVQKIAEDIDQYGYL